MQLLCVCFFLRLFHYFYQQPSTTHSRNGHTYRCTFVAVLATYLSPSSFTPTWSSSPKRFTVFHFSQNAQKGETPINKQITQYEKRIRCNRFCKTNRLFCFRKTNIAARLTRTISEFNDDV